MGYLDAASAPVKRPEARPDTFHGEWKYHTHQSVTYSGVSPKVELEDATLRLLTRTRALGPSRRRRPSRAQSCTHTGCRALRRLSKLATRRVWNVTGSMAELSQN